MLRRFVFIAHSERQKTCELTKLNGVNQWQIDRKSTTSYKVLSLFASVIGDLSIDELKRQWWNNATITVSVEMVFVARILGRPSAGRTRFNRFEWCEARANGD